MNICNPILFGLSSILIIATALYADNPTAAMTPTPKVAEQHEVKPIQYRPFRHSLQIPPLQLPLNYRYPVSTAPQPIDPVTAAKKAACDEAIKNRSQNQTLLNECE